LYIDSLTTVWGRPNWLITCIRTTTRC